MGDVTIQVTVRIPGPDEPGFLRRQRDFLQALATLNQAQTDRSPATMLAAMDALADQVALYVEVPDGQDGRELAYDLSEKQFYQILGALRGRDRVPKSK